MFGRQAVGLCRIPLRRVRARKQVPACYNPPMAVATYIFRPISAADLPRLGRWLETPHVRKWWGDPKREIELLTNDLDDPRMAMRIVELGHVPFAYVQDYDVTLWPEVYFEGLPPGSRAIDTMVGRADFLGKGHGSAYLRQRARALLAEGAPIVVIDPEASNTVARRAYKRAGFAGDTVTEIGKEKIVLMVFEDATPD